MATKKAQGKTHQVKVKLNEKDTDEKKVTTKLSLSPEFSAMATIIGLDGSYEINHLLDELMEQKNEVIDGNMNELLEAAP